MMELLIKWAAYSAVLMGAAQMLPTVRVHSWGSAFGVVAVFGVANVLLGFLLKIIFGILLFLPAILSLGLAYVLIPIVVNMILLKIADAATGDALDITGVPTLAGLAGALTATGYVLGQVL